MKISYKDTQFIIEAIDNLLSTYATRIESEDIDEDEAADLGNDCMFLESLRSDLPKSTASDLGDNHSNLSSILKKLSDRELMQTVLELPIDKRLTLADAITQSIRQELLNKAA